MVHYKTDEEIALIKDSALILGKAHGVVAEKIRPGIKTKELDKIAEEYIKDHGGTPSFKGYGGFPATLCMSLNENVVHGFPGDYELKEGDILSIDCGVLYKGFHSDSAYTYPIGEVEAEVLQLLRITKEALYLGIEKAKVGNRVGDISAVIQNFAEEHGYSIVRELVGHGVGRKLHEKPEVPNFGKSGKGPKLKKGLVIAIEPMINMGARNVIQESDGWTIRTKDRKPSAHFEHTVAVLADKTEILTTHKYIEEVFNF